MYSTGCTRYHILSTICSTGCTQYYILTTIHSTGFTQYYIISIVWSTGFTEYCILSIVWSTGFTEYYILSIVCSTGFTQYYILSCTYSTGCTQYTQYIYSIIYSATYIGGGKCAFESACFLAVPPRFVFPRKQCETNVLHAEHFQDFVVVPLQIFFNFFLFLCIFTRRCE